MKFLIDECLSPELAKLAQNKGYWESSHVIWRGLGGKKDWELMPVILDGDWTFTAVLEGQRGSASVSRRVPSSAVVCNTSVC